MSINDSLPRYAVLELFGKLSYSDGPGPQASLFSEADAKWDLFSDVVLIDRLIGALLGLTLASRRAPQTTVAKPATVQSKSWLNS